MGLFGKKKKAQQPPKAAPVNDEDFSIFSGQGLVSYIKSHMDNPTDAEVLEVVQAMAKPDADQHHLTEDGELPWGWLSQNGYICKPYEERMVQEAVDLNGSVGSDRIARLKRLIALFYEYKDFCYSKDECFIKYFSDGWEHCNNSRRKDFIYITPYEEELKELEANLDTVLQEEQRKAFIERSVKPHLRSDLLNMIRSEPGILQVDICKRYPADMKPVISDELYEMQQAGLIVKEKEGRLNKYFIK